MNIGRRGRHQNGIHHLRKGKLSIIVILLALFEFILFVKLNQFSLQVLQLEAKRSISKRDQQSQVFGSYAMVSPFIMFGDID